MKLVIFGLFSICAFAQGLRPTLEEYSLRLNKELPEVYDPVTKLLKTTVENNNLIYHFIVDANHAEFNWAFPKVKTQILKTVCANSREKFVFKELKANLVYRYENVKGQSMGEFMVRPEHCPKK